MKPKALSLICGISAVLLLAGVILTVLTIRQMPGYTQQLQQKIDTLQQIRALEQVRARQQAAIRMFESIPSHAPISLTALSLSCLTNATPEIRLRESRTLFNGWALKQVEIIFNDVDLNQISGFLNAAQAQRPPWRLTECHITASRPDSGFGRAVLIMEALSKSSDSQDKGE